MVSITLSGPRGISGKGGCPSFFIWDVGLGTEIFMRKIFALLGVPLRGPDCPRTLSGDECVSGSVLCYTIWFHWCSSLAAAVT